jgi:hypothetical protein
MEDRRDLALAPGHACASPELCASIRPGHGLGALQDRLARATALHWADALVIDVDAEGWIQLAMLDDGAAVRVWSHAGAPVRAGDPVALHTRYHVLAAGAQRLNVAVAP